MSADFDYDVFLSHSSKDKAVVHPLAERLRQDGLRVWFDEWEIRPGDSIPAKIEEGLEHSRVLVLCMSAEAFGSDWAKLESHTFRFRDPLNKDRRFIPVRLDDAPIRGSLAQFLYVNWLPQDREQEYATLLEACRRLPQLQAPSAPPPQLNRLVASDSDQEAREATTLIGDANVGIAVSQAVEFGPGQRPTVWVLGSYSELDTLELTAARKIIATLGSSLAARGVRLVSGKSDMLNELAAHCRNVAMSMNPRGPLPIFLDGKLRQTDLRVLFSDTISRIPDLAIVIGGGVSRGRVAEECIAAGDAGIPIFPVPATGGVAASVRLTADRAADIYKTMTKRGVAADTNDLVAALLKAVERYAPDADRKAPSACGSTWCSNNPSAGLTKLEINKLINRYIGVNGGYLGDFSYRTHHDFYLDLDLDIDPYTYDGTTRERFIRILSESLPDIQARILEGILDRFPVGSSDLRTQKRRDEIAGWIQRLRA
jgi:hypothetical protein